MGTIQRRAGQTSFRERQRLTRRTNGLSKIPENLEACVTTTMYGRIQDMKALWIVAAIGALAVVPCQSDGVEPAPAAPAAAGQHVTIYGAVVQQGRYVLGQGMTVKDALKLAGGAKETAQMKKLKVVRRMSPEKNVTIYLNLRIAEHDIPLKPGDVIIVDEKLDPNF